MPEDLGNPHSAETSEQRRALVRTYLDILTAGDDTRRNMQRRLGPTLARPEIIPACERSFANESSATISQKERDDSDALRAYIHHVCQLGFPCALGAVLAEVKNLLAQCKQKDQFNVEQLHDLLRVLYYQYQTGHQLPLNLALARLQTILRYLLDTRYKQGCELADAIYSLHTYELHSPDVSQGNHSAAPMPSTIQWNMQQGKEECVVDLGCGNGALVHEINRRAGKQIALGIDSNPANAVHALADGLNLRIGLIDENQATMKAQPALAAALSFEDLYGRATVALTNLTLDRVADPREVVTNLSNLVRTTPRVVDGEKVPAVAVIGVLLPLSLTDDDPGIRDENRIVYGQSTLTAGQNAREDLLLIVDRLRRSGFTGRIFSRKGEIKNPITGDPYDNYYIIVAEK